MFLLGELGFLRPLDRFTIELAVIARSIWAPNWPDATLPGDAIPRVVHIDDRSFETQFRERSPLSRRELRAILDRIRRSKPSVLAIDVDLAPVVDSSSDEKQEQKKLESMLAEMAEHMAIVLLVPFPAELESRRRDIADWMRQLCGKPRDGGIAFAYPEFLQMQGIVTNYSTDFPSMGTVAYAAWYNVIGKDRFVDRLLRAPGVEPETVCNVLRTMVGTPPFLDRLLRPTLVQRALETSRPSPLNLNYFEGGHSLDYTYSTRGDFDKDLRNAVVFLGGSWGAYDIWLTAAGRFPGVALHSATFYSLMWPVRQINHFILFGVEVLVASIVSSVFAEIWQCKQKQPNPVRALATELGVITLVVILVITCILLSGRMLAQATWFNFLPIIIGLALKAPHSLHAAHDGGHPRVEASMFVDPQRLWRHSIRACVYEHRWLIFFGILTIALLLWLD